MYTTKFVHKNIMTENGRYITIGDPYQVRSLSGKVHRRFKSLLGRTTLLSV